MSVDTKRAPIPKGHQFQMRQINCSAQVLFKTLRVIRGELKKRRGEQYRSQGESNSPGEAVSSGVVHAETGEMGVPTPQLLLL